MKRTETEAILQQFLVDGDVKSVCKVLHKLDVRTKGDLAELAAQVVVELTLKAPYELARACMRLQPPVLRVVLRTPTAGAVHLFLRLATTESDDDRVFCRSWHRALKAVAELHAGHAWGSEQKRATISGCVAEPAVLAAMQGTAANCVTGVPLEMLAVLAADGSTESADALVAQLAARKPGDDRSLDLARLQQHARATPFLDAMFAELARERAASAPMAPVPALCAAIGLDPVDPLWFVAELIGITRADEVAVVVVRFDTRTSEGFDLAFEQAALRLAAASAPPRPTDPTRVPPWLAAAADHLELVQPYESRWRKYKLRSCLRGPARGRLEQWLVGL